MNKEELKNVIREVIAEENVYSYLAGNYPKAYKMVNKVSSAVDFDIIAAMSFCLQLLEDVNAHTKMKAVEKIFQQSAKKNWPDLIQ